jgi:hypothetical protein
MKHGQNRTFCFLCQPSSSQPILLIVQGFFVFCFFNLRQDLTCYVTQFTQHSSLASPAQVAGTTVIHHHTRLSSLTVFIPSCSVSSSVTNLSALLSQYSQTLAISHPISVTTILVQATITSFPELLQ